jgi:uncharacterized protein (TIGR02246 family)
MRKMSWIAALVLVGATAVFSAQKADPDAQKIVDQYSAAFNKGDAKTLATLYAVNGTRVGPEGTLIAGRATIEKNYADGFAGPLKGSTLTLEQGATHVVTPDVKVMEGRFSTTTSIAPVKGRYVNTMVRQGKTWLLATVVTIPDPPAPK